MEKNIRPGQKTKTKIHKRTWKQYKYWQTEYQLKEQELKQV